MGEYEDNPAARYQASQIKVCAKVNQVKEPQEPPVDKKIVMVTVPYARTQNEEAKDCLRIEVIEVPEQRPIPPYMPIYTSSLDKPSFTEQYVVYQNEIIEIYDKQNPNRVIRSKQDIKRLYPSVFHRDRQVSWRTIPDLARPKCATLANAV